MVLFRLLNRDYKGTGRQITKDIGMKIYRISARVMPQEGYYVNNDPSFPEVIYTTGIAGKGGHKYCRDWNNFGNSSTKEPTKFLWATLLWSCVPSIKELASSYTYYKHFDDIPKEFGFPMPNP